MKRMVLALGLLAACSKKPSGSYDIPDANAGAAATADASVVAEADALWAQRSDKAALQQALSKYESAYNADPTNRAVAEKLVRGWYFLGDTHESANEAKIAAWDTAISWGKKCLAINQDFAAMLEKGNETEITASRVLREADVPCAYWTATALGKWARLQGLSTLLKHKDTAKAYITRVTELDPDFFHGAPDRYWGAYYAALPSFAGMDLNKSGEHFDKAIAAAPEALSSRVLKAEYWAVKTQNKAAFEQLLNEVLAADVEAYPEIKPENLAEQAKARALLAQKDELFAD